MLKHLIHFFSCLHTRKSKIFMQKNGVFKMKFKSKNFLNKISSVDIFLIIFTLLFLVQMAYSLFTDNFLSPQSGSIDAVIRTFASAVFGYFLSGNFATPTDSSSVSAYGLPIPAQTAKNETEPKNTLGFQIRLRPHKSILHYLQQLLQPVPKKTPCKPILSQE